MNKHILFIAALAGTLPAAAQTDSTANTLDAFAADSTTSAPDSVQSLSFTSARIAEVERASTAAARAREERAQARAATPAPAASSATRSSAASGKTMKRTSEGPKPSLERDPKGTKHWTRMRAKSIRKDPGSPPGTTPVY